MMREKLIALSIVKKGDWAAIHQTLQQDRSLASIDEITAVNLVAQLDCEVMTIMDDDYPPAWHEMAKPPFVVYLQGNRQLLNGQTVAVIGGKVVSDYTHGAIVALMNSLSNDVAVMTGFELGVELRASAYAKNRIAFISSGFDADEIYRKRQTYGELTTNDLIVTETPPKTEFKPETYYRSYHLLAELSRVVCVFELAEFDLRRKYLRYLTEIGKRVVVLPDKKSQGTMGGLELLSLGAQSLIKTSDVMTMLADKFWD